MQLIVNNTVARAIGSYSEAAYFDGNHCQHVAARDEHLRIQRKRTDAIKALDRRSNRR